MSSEKPERYSYNEVADLKHKLSIDPEGLTARKLKRIGVDIVKEQREARVRLEELGYEQHIQDK